MTVVHIVRRALSLTALLFGVATLAAGFRVMAGADPGYVVYRPLLIYNTLMGAVYVAAGVFIWRAMRLGQQMAASIAILNGLVLAGIFYLVASQQAVAWDSVYAMILRTSVWTGIFAGLVFIARRR